jgi:reactive chlorine resistance protein C
MKFISRDVGSAEPLIAINPLARWDYGAMSLCSFSAVLGVIEIAIGLLIALRPVWPMVSAIGSLLAAVIILTTVTFLFSTPASEPSLGGFSAIAAMPGQIVFKDVVLLGAALSSAGEALVASEIHGHDKNRMKSA